MQFSCKSLKMNYTLTILYLSENILKDKYIQMLGEMLKNNTSITSLNLNENHIEMRCILALC